MSARTIQCSTGELLQPAMRNLPERADNCLAAGDGRECGAVQQGYGEVSSAGMRSVRKGRTVYDDSHRKPRNAGVKIAERILFHVSGNKEVAMWMDNLKRRKERYYRDNLEVILRIIPGYDKNTLIEAIRICLDKGIYNGTQLKASVNMCAGGRTMERKHTDWRIACPDKAA